MLIRAYPVALLVLAAPLVRAQTTQSPSDSSGFGSIAGHVICSDTRGPARLARVTIEAVEDFKAGEASEHQASSSAVVTKLDGSFLIQSVKPGTYLILAEMPGYLSQLAVLAPDEFGFYSDEDKEKMRAMLQQVTVIGGRESRLDLRLEKGASLSGTVRYDDGSPATGVSVNLLRKGKDGTLKLVSNGLDRIANQHRTDDVGRYRIAGLTPAEYIVSVPLRRFSVSMMNGSLLGAGGYIEAAAIPNMPNMQIYSGNTARRREATPISVGKGQDIDGADITIPILKLHSVSGIVVAKQDGHPLSHGSVVLLDPSDKSTFAETWVRFEDGRFEMEFVPEGNFILRVYSAADGVVEHGTSGDNPYATYTRFKPSQSYLDAEQPVNVTGDLSGVVISMVVEVDSGRTKSEDF
jgi:hypothetical protein